MRRLLLMILCNISLIACQSISPTSDSETIKKTKTDDLQSSTLISSSKEDFLIPQNTEEKSLNCPIENYTMDETKNLWIRFQLGLSKEFTDNEQVQEQMAFILKYKSSFQLSQKNASRYLYVILEEFDKQQIPYEFALLPMIESSYDPFLTNAGTSGLWQFTTGTGRRFHLQKNNWFDGRKDPISSSRAAASYIKYLSKLFNDDWLLIMAAYNSGEGTVQKAIKRNKLLGKPIDYWNLDLPRITHLYIPKIIALAEIFRYPEKYNVELCALNNQPYFTTIKVPKRISLQEAATLSRISTKEIYYLNAGINPWATAPTDTYSLNLPVEVVDTFKNALSQYKPKNTSQNKNKNKTIPHSNKSSIVQKGNVIHYTVKSGDSLWKLAQTFKVKKESLAKWNNKTAADALKIGEKLVIWPNKKTSHSPTKKMPKN